MFNAPNRPIDTAKLLECIRRCFASDVAPSITSISPLILDYDRGFLIIARDAKGDQYCWIDLKGQPFFSGERGFQPATFTSELRSPFHEAFKGDVGQSIIDVARRLSESGSIAVPQLALQA